MMVSLESGIEIRRKYAFRTRGASIAAPMDHPAAWVSVAPNPLIEELGLVDFSEVALIHDGIAQGACSWGAYIE